MTYTYQPRNLWRTGRFHTLEAAISFGLTAGEPFDISTPSGACAWIWEMRP